MMTPRKFLEITRDGRTNPIVELPAPIYLGASDEVAAELLLWLDEKFPDATVGMIENILDSAKFWHMFWASANMANKAQAALGAAGGE